MSLLSIFFSLNKTLLCGLLIVCLHPAFLESGFFWVQLFQVLVFQGPGFLRIQVFQGTGFSRSKFFRVQVVQRPSPGSRSRFQ